MYCINLSTVKYDLHLYGLFLCGSYFYATHPSKHTVLLNYIARSKDMKQFWCTKLHTTLLAITE